MTRQAMTSEQMHTAASTLAASLRAHGIGTTVVPLGVVTSRLFIAVGRLTGHYRWFEQSRPMSHPVGDPTGAATRVAAACYPPGQ